MKRMVLAFAAVSVICCSANAEDLRSEAAAKSLANSVMQLVVQGKVEAAFALIKPYWHLPQVEFEDLVLKTIQQRALVEPRFGRVLGYAFVREEKLSDFGLRYTFVEKRERHVLRWQFIFYKPEQTWTVNALTWDDNFSALFGT